MVGTEEINTRDVPKPALLSDSLILIYQGLEEENFDQKSPGPSGWRLMQRATSSLITKKQEMRKNQTPSLGNQTEKDDPRRKLRRNNIKMFRGGLVWIYLAELRYQERN